MPPFPISPMNSARVLASRRNVPVMLEVTIVASCDIEATHLCTMMRGVKKQEATMVTSSMTGTFRRDARTRAEFMGLIGKGGTR